MVQLYSHNQTAYESAVAMLSDVGQVAPFIRPIQA